MPAEISRRMGFKEWGQHNSRYNYITYSILSITLHVANA
jgi:hypothetical protein